MIAISQSGETFDTLEACRRAIDRGAIVASICNVPGSTLESLARYRLQQNSGPEISVLSTKSVISQVVILTRLAAEHGRLNGTLSAADLSALATCFEELPATIHSVISQAGYIQELAQRYSRVRNWFFIGRGCLYPVALESALKFREVSYRHAEGLAAGFLKHGSLSLIDGDFFTLAFLPSKAADRDKYYATLANVSEIVARGGPVIGFGPSRVDRDDTDIFRDYVALPFHSVESIDAIIHLVAGQLFAYYCARHLGRQIDQPRALAKSITVR